MLQGHAVVARDSGFGDDYFFHVECDLVAGHTGEFELRAITSIPSRHRACLHCGYGLQDQAQPTRPMAIE